MAVSSTRRLLRGINDDLQAATVWDAYDNWHAHDDSWAISGLLRTGNRAETAYTPQERYYAARHVYRFAPPGSVRIDASSDDTELPLCAFRTPGGDLTLVGLNGSLALLRLGLATGDREPTGRTLRLFLTTQAENCAPAWQFPSGGQRRV